MQNDTYSCTANFLLELVYSYDNGETWQVANFGSFFPINEKFRIYDNQIYYLDSRLFELDKHSGSFVQLDLGTPTLRKYAERYDQKIYLSDAKYEPLWIENGSGLKKITNVSKAWVTTDGRYYTHEREELFYNDGLMKLRALSNCENISANIQDDFYLDVNVYMPFYENYHALFYEGKKFEKNNPDYISLVMNGTNDVYGWKKTNDKEYTLAKWSRETEEEILFDKILSPNYEFTLGIDIDGSTILISSDLGIEISKDGGATWEIITTSSLSSTFLPQVFRNEIYIQNGNALLRSTDGKTWENILEGTSQALIYDFEFNSDNHIQVYTSNGAFVSKDKVGVEERDFSNDLEINIFPNPAGETLNIESSTDITQLDIIDLNGKILRSQSDLVFDITNLPVGTYFLKLQTGEKSLYKQFVVER